MRAAEVVIANQAAEIERLRDQRDAAASVLNAEIGRLAAELEDEHTYHAACTASWERAEAALVEAKAEIERLKQEGSPGVLHEVDQAFYDLTVRERDHERQRVDRLAAEIEALRKALVYLADPESWSGNPHDQAAMLHGHFTPFELARQALGVDDEAEIVRLRSYVDDRMNREQGYDPPFKSRNLCLCEHRCGDVFEAEDDPRRSVCKGLPRKP